MIEYILNKKIYIILTAVFFSAVFFLSKNPAENVPRKEFSDKISDKFGNELPAPFEMPQISPPVFPETVCEISQYGAVPDGKTLNTSAFSKAINDCFEKGGGRVVVEAGIWLTGPIHLKSNIDLHLKKGAEIRFSPDIKNYLPAVFSRFEGVEYYNYSPLIYAANAKNISLSGEGTLNGQEELWIKNKELREISIAEIYRMAKNNTPVEKRNFANEKYLLQPSFVQMVNCENILMEKLRIVGSPNWTIHPIYSKNIIIRELKIENSASNTDGIALDSSKNVLIENCGIDSGDDAIAIKSGTDQDGMRVNIPSENIIVRNCKINSGHSGLAIGSEMSGGVRNVFAYNLDVDRVKYGIRFKSTPGRGGVVENIWVNNIKIHRAINDAIRFNMKYRIAGESYENANLPTFRNISIKDFYCRRTKNAGIFIGLPESPLENISLENVEISATKTINAENLKDADFKNVTIITKSETVRIDE